MVLTFVTMCWQNACKVVHLLLDHHADPDVICNGHSPMALAVASGNDLVSALMRCAIYDVRSGYFRT